MMPQKIRTIPAIDAFPEKLRADLAENWEKYTAACDKAGISMPEDSEIVHALKLGFAFSPFVARWAARAPGIIDDLLASGDLVRSYHAADYTSKLQPVCQMAESEADLITRLRRSRCREMLRIAIRDLCGWADLFETVTDLTHFAEICLDCALTAVYQWMSEQYGTPRLKDGSRQLPVVLGVGKLGGAELNYSSDVDLLFAYPEMGQIASENRPMTHEEFFSKLFRRLINILTKNTPDGFVFRVDTRLRPYGDSGPITMSFDALETYYQHQGREWERYALIKARPVAGDREAGNRLIDRLRPFVFRRYLDFGTFEDLRDMKRKIVQEVKRKGLFGNIKQGAGGIREIEFFGQVFQLIRGGVNPAFQTRNLLATLKILLDENCIPDGVYNELGDAYRFLRDTEHRLQAFEDRQTHTLPKEEMPRSRLALAMGFSDWEAFDQTLSAHMDRVHYHFNELLADPSEASGQIAEAGQLVEELWSVLSDSERARQILSEIGFTEPDKMLEILRQFLAVPDASDITCEGRDRIYRLMPQILQKAAETESPAAVLQRVFELIRSIRRRSCYMALLLENPEALTHLIQLAAASSWIVSFLARHPLLLDELLDPRSLYVPLGKSELEQEIRQRIDRVDPWDLEQQMDELRVFKQSHTLRIAAADVAGLLPLMKVSDRLTYLAETILDAVLSLSWAHLENKYGLPGEMAGDSGKGFAVVAYGKLGGYELGYGSDLDLVFLHAAPHGYTTGGRLSPIDNHQFYVRLGQRVIHFLTTMTSTGKLYEADMRLRPSGNAGVLVSHIDAFAEYQRDEAWTWEHQALLKARPISGDPEVGRQFLDIRRRILNRERKIENLRQEVADMRRRMREAHGSQGGKKTFDIKNDPGGIIDIEFLVQYLILVSAHEHPEVVRWTDVVRQLNALAIADVIDDITAHILKQAYLVYRYLVHRLSLQQKPAKIAATRLEEHRQRVRRIWEQYVPSA